jgi:flagellar motor switch protein FliN/FliY
LGILTGEKEMSEWVSRLATLLREASGGEVSIDDAGPSRGTEPGPDTLWWKCSSGQPPVTVWIGMEQASAAALLERILKTNVPAGDLQTEYRKLLDRLDEKGEVGDERPASSALDTFAIRFEGTEPLRLYMALSNSDDWSNLEVLKDIELPVTLRFGMTRMTLQDLTSLNTGSVIEFDGGLHDPVEVLVNGRVIARGEAVIVQDSYAVRISEIASPPDRITFQREA